MIGSDLRHAVRLFGRTPAFTLPAIASLALGIAVNTTMFSVVNALFLRPLPTSRSDTLVRVGRSMNDDGSFRSLSYEEFEFLQRHASSFSDLVGHQIASVFIRGSDGAQFVSAEIVTSSYFRALEKRPVLGRSFDETIVDDHSVVISERFWRQRFGAAPTAVGRGVAIDDRPFTIIGVAPPGFMGTFPGVATDVWLPSVRPGTVPRTDPRTQDGVGLVMGLLSRDASIETARVELQDLSRRMSELNPRRESARGFVLADSRGIHPGIARGIRPFVAGMMGIGGVVLLIVCANVASLVLARANARRAELAVRLALGAARRRVVTQLLVESGLLALVGATAGFAFSFWAVRSINAVTMIPGPTGAPVFLDVRLDHRVLIFTAAVTMLATIAFALIPAVQGARVNIMAALNDPQSAPGRSRSRWRGALVIVQVTVSVVLMVGAVLLVRSVRNSTRVDLGFDPDRVTVISFNLQPLGYDRTRAEQFYGELLRRARGLPGVEQAALADFIPMGGRGGTVTVQDPRSTLPSGEDHVSAAYNRVSDGYFATVGQTLIRGRGFTSQDRSGTPAVAVVNETMARRFWPTEDAIGKRIRIVSEPGDPGQEREIVGVANDARYRSFGGDVGPFVFLPVIDGGRASTLHIRAASHRSAVLRDTHALVREIDAHAVPQSSQMMREAMSFALVPARIAQTVLGVAGIIALLLATGGLYGLVCYTLEQRVKEIGIRVALGASRERIFRLIVGSTVRLTAIGVALGMLLAAGAMRLVSSLLIGLSPTDPLTFASVAALMAAVTLGAAYVAARKGLRVDPVVMLKHE